MTGESKGLSVAEIDIMRSVEDELWWYRALRGHVLRSISPTQSDFKLLDAGCGSGGMLARLREKFPRASLTGLDLSDRSLEVTEARKVGAQLVQGSVDSLPFAGGEFNFVVSLDVLCSQGVNDHVALSEMRRVLVPGGTMILNLPAFDFLRGQHDVAVNLARRYTRPELRQLLRQVGFTIRKMTYWNMSLLPAVAAVRWTSRRHSQKVEARSDLAPMASPLNVFLSAIAELELAISQSLPLPFGTSIFAVATK